VKLNKSTKILLIGKNGQVGWELQRTLQPLGEVMAVVREQMDVSDPDSIKKIIREVQPKIIVNAAAYTAVDKAESEPELAMKVNGVAPGIMAEEAKQLGALLVHYSTDYVFDGTKQGAYTEEDTPNPLSVYGKTKLAGEQAIQASGAAHLILRTSWVYGMRGKNFLLTILRLAQERPELKIVDDQIGAPTWSRMIAESTAQILARCFSPIAHHSLPITEFTGIYHLTAGGQTSWYGFAKAILESSVHFPHFAKAPGGHKGGEGGFAVPKLIPITTTEYPLPAPRPSNSVMSNEKLARVFGIVAPQWDDALRLCMEERAK
jgi:dTDP-4-dehydrorhamnose reductase